MDAEPGWYAVRSVLRLKNPSDQTGSAYEERITLWHAASFAEAIEKAEAESKSYVDGLDLPPNASTDLVQAYHLFDEPGDGAEIFSLIRLSELEPEAYLDTYFDTGTERQQT